MAVFFVVWALVALWTANAVLLPSPLAVFDALVDLARDLELFMHAGISLGRMVVSLAHRRRCSRFRSASRWG